MTDTSHWPTTLPSMRSWLEERLRGPIDRAALAEPFSPDLSFGRHRGPAPSRVRRAAVVCVMMQCEGSWMIPLTVRPEHLKHHGGQVCFPGGECDPGETMEVAAAREWHEELGVDGDALEFVGRLAPVHVFASNYIVAPCVAVAPRQQFRPSADEVDEIVWLDPTTPPIPHGTQTIERGSLCFQTPYLECGGRRVWGATAVMLGELLTRLAPHTHRGD